MKQIFVALAFVQFFDHLSVSLPAEAQQTLLQQAALATDVDFVSRVKIASVKMAYTVSLEDGAPVSCVAKASDCAVRRKALATQVASNPTGWASQIATVVVGDTTLTAASTDQQLIDAVFQRWNLLAGVQAQ